MRASHRCPAGPGWACLDLRVSVFLADNKKRAKELLSDGAGFGETRDGNGVHLSAGHTAPFPAAAPVRGPAGSRTGVDGLSRSASRSQATAYPLADARGPPAGYQR